MFHNPFYFLRHGETEWNLTKRTQGQTNTSLNETGRAQARVAADILKDEPIARIVSSPLDRVRHTAEAVAEFHDVPMTFDDDLMECHLGDHQGEPHGSWLADYWTGEYDPPGGETFDEFAERVWNAMARAVALGPDTLIVAHGGLWIAANSLTRVDPPLLPVLNASPIHVVPHESGWSPRRLEV